MRLSVLLRNILFLTTTQSTNNGNTGSPPNSNSTPHPAPPSTTSSPITPTPPLLPREPFTDPNLISQPPTFYETASALLISAGRTYTTTYIDLISGTAAFPITPTITPLLSTTSLIISCTTTLQGKDTATHCLTTTVIANIPNNNPPSTSSGTFPSLNSAQRELCTQYTNANQLSACEYSVLGLPNPSNPTATPSPSPSPSPATSSITPIPSTSTSPVLNLAPCSTFTGAESALEGCISSVVGELSLTGGGPIVASTTFSSSGDGGGGGSSTTAAGGEGGSVTPTRTVTLPYLGKVVAKGKATFVVGGVESKGVRGRGRGGGRGLVVGVGIGFVVMVGGG